MFPGCVLVYLLRLWFVLWFWLDLYCFADLRMVCFSWAPLALAFLGWFGSFGWLLTLTSRFCWLI